MTATAQPRPAATLVAPNLRSRVFGFGSVFGKTIRDSRRAAIAVALFIGVLLVIVAQAIASEFSTPESRQEIGNLVTAVPPILAGLAGRAVNVEALGGYIQYKYGGFFPLVTALWSILALSATLAAEVPAGQHGDPRRRARDPPADRHREGRRPRRDAHAGDGVRLCRHGRGGHLRDAARRRDPGPGRIRVCCVAVAHRVGRRVARLRAGAIRRPRVGRGHRGCRDVRGLPAQRLPDGDPRAGAVREPHVVRVDDQPSPARRLVRLGFIAARRGCDHRVSCDRRGGVRSPRHRPDQHDPDPEPPARAEGPARADRPHLRRAAANGARLGHRPGHLRAGDGRVGQVVRRADRQFAGVHPAHQHRCSPIST